MLLTWLGLLAATAVQAGKHEKPNIVLILTDDQDTRSFQRKFLPRIYEHLVDEGVLYNNFFTPVSICCPSRVSLLRTQLAHNHNITYVMAPWGGWDVFNDYGYVGHTLPDFLQQAGYDTYYTGKYMNSHTVKNCVSKPVSGFTSSDFLVDPFTYDYWNPAFSRDNGPPTFHKGEYSTDLIRDKALAYLDDGIKSDKPFFVGIAPIAPHSAIEASLIGSGRKVVMDIPSSHPRHEHLFADEVAPRVESFNYDTPLGVSWVKTLPKLNDTQVEYLDEFHRGRLRSLQAVDELVEEVVRKLEAAGELDNTYIFYTSDNGFTLGTHRRQPGKTLGFEEDIHVPFVARGPKVPKAKQDDLSSYGMVDLSRTILDIAGAAADYVDDGVRIDLHDGAEFDKSAPSPELARQSLSEFWVYAVEEGKYAPAWRDNSTYRTLRVHDEGTRDLTYSYSVWCTGERELYDLTNDPYQITNLLAEHNASPFAAFDSLSTDVKRIVSRLDALMLVLKTCVGPSCTAPWSVLFPQHGVTGLSQALEPKYDEFFGQLPRVKFDECALGYQARREEPLWRDSWAFTSQQHTEL